MNSPLCTLADIAKKIGMSSATVSMALRNNPRISKKTRALVKKTAKSLGYHPDPLLSALAIRKRQSHTPRTFANLAFITDDRWRLQPNRGEWVDSVIGGMRECCSHLGYELDVFGMKELLNLGDPDRILSARGIRGLVIPSLLKEDFKLQLDWDRYAVVAMGAHPTFHRFHRIGTDFFAGMGIVCSELARLGYRRVGLAHAYEIESNKRFEWLGALAKESYLVPQRIEPVPPHLPAAFTKDGYIRWIKTHKPECVISNEPLSLAYLKEAGIRVPEDIGYVALSTARHAEKVAGVIINNSVLGEIAIMQLHGLILRGESGASNPPKETLVCPMWTPWNTVRKIG